MSKTECREGSRHQNSYLVSAAYEGSSESIPLRPPDLSVAGMFINTPQYLPVGSVLKLRLMLSGRELPLRAEVRHWVPGQGVGVEFVNPPADAQRAIEEELKARSASTCVYFPPQPSEPLAPGEMDPRD